MEKENIVMFPFMAQGHIRPFLALALKIEQKGDYQITFVSTPLNIKNLQATLPPSSTIRLLEIPFNSSDHGLPPDSENTDSLPSDLISRLVEASSSLEPRFRKLLSDLIDQENGARPLCVVADIIFGWSAEVSREFGIFHVIYSAAGGFGLACFYSEWMHLWHRKTDDSGHFMLADFPEAGRFHVTQLSPSMLNADGKDVSSVLQRRNFPLWVNADGLLFNTVEEIDNIGLSYFRRELDRPVWAIGPILLSVNDGGGRSGEMGAGSSPESCKEWLDAKPHSSVLYISFGSQNTISASQMIQLAKALDASGTSFIWVIRPPIGFHNMNAKFKAEEWLPEGFTDRVKQQKKGLIVEKWAPQVEILSHKSIGAFLSHCGWNSVLESLSHGVPLIGWPMAAEQFFNAKFLVEMVGVCVEVARGTSFEVTSEDILEKIELVMSSDESGKGKEMRRKACEIEEIVKNGVREEGGFKGSSVKGLEEFLDAALLVKKKKMKKKIN